VVISRWHHMTHVKLSTARQRHGVAAKSTAPPPSLATNSTTQHISTHTQCIDIVFSVLINIFYYSIYFLLFIYSFSVCSRHVILETRWSLSPRQGLSNGITQRFR
jgi:hypothetical protein